MNYVLKDISVVIATYNRADDLKITLNSLMNKIRFLREVIIVDQSKNKETKNLINKIDNKRIKYYYVKNPSLTGARNFGISKLSSLSRIAIFLDDDVTLGDNYFDGILEVFNKYPSCKGAGGYFLPRGAGHGGFESVLRRIFYIEHFWKDSAKVYSAYGAVYPSKLTKTIVSGWIPGFNMAYKKEVFEHEKFDERFIKYGLAEDFDFSCRVAIKYPNSLYITPNARIVHRVSSIERMPKEDLAYMNQINHLFIHYKNFKGLFNQIKLFWVLYGILLLRVFIFLLKRQRKDYVKLIFFIKSVIYVFRNLPKLRRGNLTELYKPFFN